MDAIRVHVAHDNPLLRDTLAFALAAQPDIQIVEISPEGEAGMQRVNDRRTDVLVLAVSPREPVFDEVVRYRRLTPTTKIVGLYTTRSVKHQMVAAGTDAVVFEHDGLGAVIEAVRLVAPP